MTMTLSTTTTAFPKIESYFLLALRFTLAAVAKQNVCKTPHSGSVGHKIYGAF
eukprot:SAG11_NODE_14866_length_597_cov_0.929719_1_plen_53_part_00